MSAVNVELARRGYEAVARGDLDVISDLLAPDVKWHGGDASAGGACQNRHQALKFMRVAIGRGGVGQLVEVIDAGDRIVVVLQPPSSGSTTPPLRANLTTFRDGKVVEMVAYESPGAGLAAAGIDGH
jgi:ketosteroid isomerase-like protein